jgi:dTDP-4-amino-4,6-dideoxygalactose transaminase
MGDMTASVRNRAINRVIYQGDLSQPDPIPPEGIAAANALMQDGRLFRYGEDRNSLPEAALLEEEFAACTGRRFCVGVNSGGCALFVALKSAGLLPGDKVLVNAFTLAPVPGAIAHAGGQPVLVDITERTVIDVDDLDRKAAATGARYLMLSYMRGHIPDMDAVMQVCRKHDLIVIEDCAHTMGAGWNGRLTGAFGQVACFSTQTFKHINSGEGGLIVTDDEDIAARAILMSGSYMLYAQHRARPALEVFERHRLTTPNCSMRMSNLAAAVLRPQLKELDERNAAWRRVYDWLAPLVDAIPHLEVPARPEKEQFVPSSLQFLIKGLTPDQCACFVSQADAHGVHVKWFGKPDPAGFTSRHDHWQYVPQAGEVPCADTVLRELCDLRLPSALGQDDCRTIATVLAEAMEATLQQAA